VKPTPSQWNDAKERYRVGALVRGRVVRVEAFGVFVDLDCPAIGLLLVTHFEDGPRGFNIDEYPPVGASIDAVVVHHEESNMQIRLSSRASDMSAAG